MADHDCAAFGYVTATNAVQTLWRCLACGKTWTRSTQRKAS